MPPATRRSSTIGMRKTNENVNGIKRRKCDRFPSRSPPPTLAATTTTRSETTTSTSGTRAAKTKRTKTKATVSSSNEDQKPPSVATQAQSDDRSKSTKKQESEPKADTLEQSSSLNKEKETHDSECLILSPLPLFSILFSHGIRYVCFTNSHVGFSSLTCLRTSRQQPSSWLPIVCIIVFHQPRTSIGCQIGQGNK